MSEQSLMTMSSQAGNFTCICTINRVCLSMHSFLPAESSLDGGAVAGIMVGVIVFVALAVAGVLLAIILTWYFRRRDTRHFVKMESEGLENPNYGIVHPIRHQRRIMKCQCP